MNSVRSNNQYFKYKRFTPLGCLDNRIRKFELVAKKLFIYNYIYTAAEFKEFERWFKFKPRFKYDWFHLKLFQDLSRRLI